MNTNKICLYRIEDHDGHKKTVITDDYNFARRSVKAGKRVYIATFIQHENGQLEQAFNWQPLKIWSSFEYLTP